MIKEEFEKLKETVAYFGHWYDVIGEERVSILEKSIEYIVDLEKENAKLKEQNEKLLGSCAGATMMYEDLCKADEVEQDIKANCDLAIEGRDIKIKELELELTVEKDQHQEEINLHLHAEDYIKELEQQIEKMKRHCNCKHRDSEGYCEVKRTYLIDLSYDGCDKWELED